LLQQEELTEVTDDKATESATSMGVVMTTMCLYWAFVTATPEQFGSFLTEMQTRIEQLGWKYFLSFPFLSSLSDTSVDFFFHLPLF